jgi:DNA repair protein RecO (recombination protein O)
LLGPIGAGWAPGLIAYEALVLREMGYGARFGAGIDGQRLLAGGAAWSAVIDGFDRIGEALARYVLADHRHDVMGARERLRERLSKIDT